jgi:hypothetical protein
MMMRPLKFTGDFLIGVIIFNAARNRRIIKQVANAEPIMNKGFGVIAEPLLFA